MVDFGAGPSRWTTARFATISCGGAGLDLAAGGRTVQPGDRVEVRFLADGHDVSLPARVANVSGARIGVAFLLSLADVKTRHGFAAWVAQQVGRAQALRDQRQPHSVHRVAPSAKIRAKPGSDRLPGDGR